MNPRITTLISGLIILALGAASLLYPERVMGLLGFQSASPAQTAAVLGEVRATYGGVFAVMGLFTMLAAMDPRAHRARILFVGVMWLGAAAVEGHPEAAAGGPGVPGWVALVFEVLLGGALVSAAAFARPTQAAQVANPPATPPVGTAPPAST